MSSGPDETSACLECGAGNPAERSFCTSCGTKLGEPRTRASAGQVGDAPPHPGSKRSRRPRPALLVSVAVLALAGALVGFLIGSPESGPGGGKTPDPKDTTTGASKEVELPANFEKMPKVLPLDARGSAGRPETRPFFELTERGYQLVRDDALELEPRVEPVDSPSTCGSIDYGLPGSHGLLFVEGYGLRCGEVFRLLADWLREEGEGAPEGWTCWRAWWPRTEEIRCTYRDVSITFRPS